MEATKVCIHRWKDKEDVVFVYSGILLSHKENEILPFAAKWLDLEGIMLSEISQTEKTNTVWYHLYVESKKYKKLVNKQKKADSQIQRTN